MANVNQAVGLEGPVTEQELRDIAPMIANDRKTVAANLGFKDYEIAIIEADCDKAGQGGITEKAFQMLLKWKQKNGEGATKWILGKALEGSGLLTVAEALVRNIR